MLFFCTFVPLKAVAQLQRPEHAREEFIDETPHDEDVEVVADKVVEQETVVRSACAGCVG